MLYYLKFYNYDKKIKNENKKFYNTDLRRGKLHNVSNNFGDKNMTVLNYSSKLSLNFFMK